jgi:hypothetical protein
MGSPMPQGRTSSQENVNGIADCPPRFLGPFGGFFDVRLGLHEIFLAYRIRE